MKSVVACPCGAVEITVEGQPLAQFYCHCADCRKMNSGAYAAESVHRENEITVTRGETKMWMLSRSPRHFCATCGGRLFIEIPSKKLRGLNGLLLPPGEFKPTLHVNCASAEMPIRDDLPHFAAMPPAFGGSDDKVDW